jgi:hypothetical protein
MHRVTAKIAEEVFVLFEDDDVDTRTCEQVAEHDPSRSAAGDAAPSP